VSPDNTSTTTLSTLHFKMPTLLSPEIAGCFARACHTISVHDPSVNRNDLFKAIINHTPMGQDAIADVVVHDFIRKFPICERSITMMENRPKKGRVVGECMDNCIAEFKETGNQIRMGLVSSAKSAVAALAVVHFFNVDRHGVFYDTEDRTEGRRRATPATLVKLNHDEVIQILMGRQRAFLKAANDWLSIWDEMNKKTYILSRTFGETGAFKFVQTVDTDIEV
jgi:hypothetical protein